MKNTVFSPYLLLHRFVFTSNEMQIQKDQDFDFILGFTQKIKIKSLQIIFQMSLNLKV